MREPLTDEQLNKLTRAPRDEIMRLRTQVRDLQKSLDETNQPSDTWIVNFSVTTERLSRSLPEQQLVRFYLDQLHTDVDNDWGRHYVDVHTARDRNGRPTLELRTDGESPAVYPLSGNALRIYLDDLNRTAR